MIFKDIKFTFEEINFKDAEMLIFFLLYPDNNGETPFELAIKD
jgi:hypothetical protein